MVVAERPTILVVSVLPRGATVGASMLVSLAFESLEAVGMRPFPADEYLLDPCGSPAPIEHCRGIVQVGNELYAALFNGVGVYQVADARELRLDRRRMLTHPSAVDLHGIHACDSVVVAASTGADAIISWETSTRDASVIGFGGADASDLRFPHRIAREHGCADWREVLRARLHINDVCRRDDGTTVVCSLKRVVELTAEGVRTLMEDKAALLHDGRWFSDGQLLFTDAARGELLALDPERGTTRRLPIADPSNWFVRGLSIVGQHVVVLRSQRVRSRQRDVRIRADCRPAKSTGRFGISIVDLAGWRLEADRVVMLPDANSGSVAYAVIGWRSNSTPPETPGLFRMPAEDRSGAACRSPRRPSANVQT